MFKNLFAATFVLSFVAGANAQTIFNTALKMPAGYTPTTVLMPPSPLGLQVLFVGGHDLVQTTATYGNPAGQAIAKEWHDFIGFTPDKTGASLGWVSVNHETIYRDDRIGDGGGMTVFRVERDPITGLLNVVDQQLEDGRRGKFFNVDFVNTVGETGMNCGGISSVVDGRIWTAEEWFTPDNATINESNTIAGPVGALPLLPLDSRPSAQHTGSFNQGVRDTLDIRLNTPEFPAFDGQVIKKYQNFNWMVEIDPRQAVAIRKQYNWGRQGFESGSIAADNRTVYLGVDETPAYWVKFVADTPGDFTKGKTYVYKHDIAERWVEIDNTNMNKMLKFGAEAAAAGGTMYNRIEWVAVDKTTGLIYWTETGRDNVGGAWAAQNAAGAVHEPYHRVRAAATGVDINTDDYKDYYGRVWVYDPLTQLNSVLIEGGPFLAESPAEANYPSKHLTNPDGLNVMTIDGQSFLVICEDLNGTSFGRTPAGVSNATCEVFMLNLAIKNPKVEDLIRLTAVPQGAEVTGVMPTPDGKSLLINSQHPRSSNPFPFNHSLTFAIHGFDKLTVAGLSDPNFLEGKTGFRIRSNPSTREVFFNEATDVAIYNAAGERLSVYRQVSSIDVSALTAGIYFLQAANGEIQQLVIQ